MSVCTRLYLVACRKPAGHKEVAPSEFAVNSRWKPEREAEEKRREEKRSEGKGREGKGREEKRREEERERVRRKKIQVREKVGKSRNTVFFQ